MRGKLSLDGALEAYSRGVPVVLLSTRGDLLHGRETLEVIAKLGTELECLTVPDVSADVWEKSAWPEVLEAARQVFVKQRGFDLRGTQGLK
jgi:hypothetical protein